ncbi:AAA family ATPase [Streptomyces europaeiscabiei]|uniref:AAA family ATPase n=1 Tax=Streptomyces europaeiscabiei TaxID=146819 RepID=UPI0029B0105C|nr:AAA family ATPase [Streptomyces europaeiscabiei]MDX3694753.1 AAA family ATPase [Streptomyces europaeiscabiei]
MRFIVLEADELPQDGRRACLLVPAPWPDDDYLTLYHLWFRDGNGTLHQLGQVKIAYADLIRDERPLGTGEFNELTGHGRPLHWFSVGQSDMYYENIRKLGVGTRIEILRGLCDIAFSSSAFDSAIGWDVTQTSLLRSVTPQTVEVQFRRIAHGGPRLTAYHFAYLPPPSGTGLAAWSLAFSVEPHSRPPTNIHVLIGRNGVGKTTVLGNIARAVLDSGVGGAHAGEITWPDGTQGSFANVVAVTFSAFDPAQDHTATEAGVDEKGHPQLKGWDGSKDVSGEQTPPAEPVEEAVAFTYVGLAKVDELGRPTRERKSYDDLAEEFSRSVEEIMAAGRVGRWIDALDKLGSDPHFYESSVHGFARIMQTREEFLEDDDVTAREIFSSLSSGHAVILLTMTRLVETVAEQSLVLLDEPEAHLHPPLLASFIGALSDLLTDRNGVALMGTHSPVVLQEVPRSCVWKVSRFDRRAPERPALETYGENVGILTHEVFNLEVRESGFHAEIEKAVNELASYERVLEHFGGHLGGEAKGLVRILLAHRAGNGHR